MQSHKKDRDIVIHEELESQKKYLEQLRDVFDEMDQDDTGLVSLTEFEKSLDDEKVIAYFNYLKLDCSDARMLFQLMDFDLSEEVSINEFLQGCYSLQGEARSLDQKIMRQVKWLTEMFLSFSIQMDELRDAHGLPVP